MQFSAYKVYFDIIWKSVYFDTGLFIETFYKSIYYNKLIT